MLLLFAIGAVGFFTIDVATAPSQLTTTAGEPSLLEMPEPATRKAFVLIVDSLRSATAFDPAVMPELSKLAEAGLSAVVQPSRDAVTVSCLRETFTGRSRFTVFGFVSNFFKSAASIESIFTELRSFESPELMPVVYSDGSFIQFGADVRTRRYSAAGDGATHRQLLAIDQALKEHRQRAAGLTIVHVVFSDRIAHEEGVHSQAYRDVFASIDRKIGTLGRSLGPHETFVVMGDHGHTDTGRHALGLDVPTALVYRGARFVPSSTLPRVPLAIHRYLLSWALGLNLSPLYEGPRPSHVLLGAPPASFLPLPGRTSDTPQDDTLDLTLFGLLVAFLSGLFALWYALVSTDSVSTDSDRLRWTIAAAMLGLLVAGFSTVRFPWNVGLSALAALGVLAGPVRSRGGQVLFKQCGLIVLACCAFAGLGVGFTHIRVAIHEPAWIRLEVFWLCVYVLSLGVWKRWGSAAAAWSVLAIVLLLPPTVYRYGAPGAFGHAWLMWTVLLGLEVLAAGPKVRVAGIWAGLLYLVHAHTFGDATGFQFDRWFAWFGSITPSGAIGTIMMAVLSKLGLLAIVAGPAIKPGASRRQRLTTAGLATVAVVGLLLHQFEMGAALPRLGRLAVLLLVLLSAWRVAVRMAPGASVTHRRVAMFAGLYGLYLYALRVDDLRLHVDALLLGIGLSAYLLRLHAGIRPDEQRPHRIFLYVVSLFAAGWMGFEWTIHNLEWGFLYDVFDAGLVEEHVSFFVPFLLAKYALVVVLIRLLFVATLADDFRLHRRFLWAGAARFASLVMFTVGVGAALPATDVYLEGVQQAAIVFVLLLGLF